MITGHFSILKSGEALFATHSCFLYNSYLRLRLKLTMKVSSLSILVGIAGIAIADGIVGRDIYSGPAVNTKNGTYGDVYLSTYDQDVFLGVRYSQVNKCILPVTPNTKPR